MPNTFRDLCSALEDQGWSLTTVAVDRVRAKPPGNVGRVVEVTRNIDHTSYAFQNVVRELKKGGFVWPPPDKRARREGKRDVPATTGSQTLSVPPSELRTSREAREDALPLAGGLVPKGAVAAAAPPPVAPLDDAFRRLKDAREYLAIADEETEKTRLNYEAKVDEATRMVDLARSEHEKAVVARREAAEALAAAKRTFDGLFPAEVA